MNARQEWHAVLDDVLEGSHEDLEPIMFSARYATLHSCEGMGMHACTYNAGPLKVLQSACSKSV